MVFTWAAGVSGSTGDLQLSARHGEMSRARPCLGVCLEEKGTRLYAVVLCGVDVV